MVDARVARAARVYDYLLGGTVNFAVDREAAVHVAGAVGGLDVARTIVRANRDFLGEVVRHLAAEVGVRQFLDIGTGIPARGNVHEVAQRPSRGPRRLRRLRPHRPGLLPTDCWTAPPRAPPPTSTATCATPGPSWSRPPARSTLGQPVAVVLVGVLHFIRDAEDPYAHRCPAHGGHALRQLPGHQPPGRRPPGDRDGRDGRALRPVRRRGSDRAQPRRGLPLPRRPGPGRGRRRPRRPVGQPDAGTDPPEGWVTPVYGALGRKP